MILLLLIYGSFYYLQQISDRNKTEADNTTENFKGVVQVSTWVTEAFVVSNKNNQLELHALGLNPTVRLRINDIENGEIQQLAVNLTNISPERVKVYLNNNSIDIASQNDIEKYSIITDMHSISLKLVVEQANEFEIRYVTQLNAGDFSFAVLGDTQGRNDIFEIMVSEINAKEPDFILHCGDLTTMGTVAQFDEFLTVASKLNAPIFTTAGNHDVKSGGDNYKALFGPADYMFQVGVYKFISMDSSSQDLSTEQLGWLENQSNEKNIKKILYTHVPLFSNTLPEHLYINHEVPTKLMGVLEKNDFEYCFSGHLHLFNYTQRVGIKYITTGGGGAAPYAPEELGGFRHFIHVKVYDNFSEFEVVRMNEDLFNNRSASIELNGPSGKIMLDLDDLKTFEYIEGPSACQNQCNNWVGNGTYKGVEIKRLVELVGGLKKNGTLVVNAIDGYHQEFSYSNINLNTSWKEIQGPLILSYQFDGLEPPLWVDGLRLVTIPPDTGYSLEDCEKTSVPGQGCWEYESAGARWVKNVTSIIVVNG